MVCENERNIPQPQGVTRKSNDKFKQFDQTKSPK